MPIKNEIGATATLITKAIPMKKNEKLFFPTDMIITTTIKNANTNTKSSDISKHLLPLKYVYLN